MGFEGIGASVRPQGGRALRSGLAIDTDDHQPIDSFTPTQAGRSAAADAQNIDTA